VSAGAARRAWAVLSPPTREELSSYPLEVLAHDRPCRLALGPDGARHLLIPAGAEHLAPAERAGTLVTTVRPLTFGGSTASYLDIACGDAGVFEPFDEVVEDVLETVSGSTRPAEDALAAIARWRNLFRSRLVRGLGPQELRGLFAELVVLEALLTHAPSTPVSVWTGPLRQAHDFELPARCLEVKALGATSATVVIHGLSQLAAHDDRPLDLVLVHVVEDADGVSITDLVDRITAVASEPAMQALLDATGWTTPPTGAAEDTFVVAEVLRVPVGQATPRLVEALLAQGSIMDGVVNVTYEIRREALLAHVDGSSLRAVATGVAQ